MCFDVQTNRIRLLNELRHENTGWINRHLACNYCSKPGPVKQADKLSLLVLFEEGKCFDCYELHMKIYCAFSICHLYCGIILLLYWILIAVIMQVREPIWILKRLVYLVKGRPFAKASFYWMIRYYCHSHACVVLEQFIMYAYQGCVPFGIQLRMLFKFSSWICIGLHSTLHAYIHFQHVFL